VAEQQFDMVENRDMVSDSLGLGGSHVRMSDASGESLGQEWFGEVDAVEAEAGDGLTNEAVAWRVVGDLIDEHGTFAFDEAEAVGEGRRWSGGACLAGSAPGREFAAGRGTSAETPIHEWPAEPVDIASTSQTASPPAPVLSERRAAGRRD
jgi:hypothetical protein